MKTLFDSSRIYKQIINLENGEYRTIVLEKEENFKGIYFSYVQRAAEILNAPGIFKQLRNEQKIFNQAILKHFVLKVKFWLIALIKRKAL